MRAETVDRLLAQRQHGADPGFTRPGVGLVVGDRPDRIGLLHDALHEHLGRVWTANDEPTATAMAIAEQPDIAVIDEDVAGFSGFDTALTIRDFSPATCIVLVIDDDGEVGVDLEQAEMFTGGIATIEKLDQAIRRFLG